MESEKKLEFLWYDHKMHTVTISNGTDDIEIDPIRETYRKVLEDKKDQCKNIYFLGAGLCGGSYEGANGFLLGWLVKSIRDDLVKRDGLRLLINHEERDVTDDEAREYAIRTLESYIAGLKDTVGKIKKVPILRGDVDGGELF